MPVVSSTDWIDIKIGSTVKQTAKIQITLAIGTADQLKAYKASKSITILPCATSRIENPPPPPKRANPALADMLSTFIDNLALNIPKRPESDPRHQLRRTSDLLDLLQNSLKNPAPVGLITSSSALKSGKALNVPANHCQKATRGNVRVVVNVDSARNLAIKENAQDCYRTTTNDEAPRPSAWFVSFEAIGCGDNGGQYSTFTTKLAESHCNPTWNEKFDVMLPMDFIQKEVRFSCDSLGFSL